MVAILNFGVVFRVVFREQLITGTEWVLMGPAN